MTTSSVIEGKVLAIVASHSHREGALLPILHDVQSAFRHVPREAIPVIAKALNLSRAEVYGVVSFYGDFTESPIGRRHLKLCRAEACQARGGRELACAVLSRLKLAWDETNADGSLTVSSVYCLGLCSVAPAASIDGAPMGRVTADGLLRELGSKR